MAQKEQGNIENSLHESCLSPMTTRGYILPVTTVCFQAIQFFKSKVSKNLEADNTPSC
jgi:hypothetical protein